LFSSLDISVLVHATEDDNKIIQYILEYFEKSSNSKQIEIVKTEGHWKNPITRINITLSKHMDYYFEILMNELKNIHGEIEFTQYLKNNVDEKGSIYLRLDKQKLCLGKVNLSANDSVRLIFRSKGKFEK
jgi:RNA binding exosome subunit